MPPEPEDPELVSDNDIVPDEAEPIPEVTPEDDPEAPPAPTPPEDDGDQV